MFLYLIYFLLIFLIIYIYIYNYKIALRKNTIKTSLNANLFIEDINRIIDENKYNLFEERRRLKQIDAYGNEDLSKWLGNPPLTQNELKANISQGASKFKEGIPYFFLKVILKNFEHPDMFFKKWECYRITNPVIKDEIMGLERKLNHNDWFIFLASIIEKSCEKIDDNDKTKNLKKYNKGINFEIKCLEILKQKGWDVKETPLSGDQGVDLIASIDQLRLCIQCKNHLKPIGNKAVQEISAGKQYWRGTHAILVSNSGFTKSAYKLASANKVILISEYELKNIENIIF